MHSTGSERDRAFLESSLIPLTFLGLKLFLAWFCRALQHKIPGLQHLWHRVSALRNSTGLAPFQES